MQDQCGKMLLINHVPKHSHTLSFHSKMQINSGKIQIILRKLVIDSLFSLLILTNFNNIFNYHNPPLFIIQHKWMCRRDITCTNNASSSLSSLSQIIITIHYPSPPSSLLSYTSLSSLYLDWKPGPKCKGNSTLQLWCRAWSV